MDDELPNSFHGVLNIESANVLNENNNDNDYATAPEIAKDQITSNCEASCGQDSDSDDEENDEISTLYFETVKLNSKSYCDASSTEENVVYDDVDNDENIEEETDEVPDLDTKGLGDSDEYDRNALKAAYLAVLASEDANIDIEPLDTSLEEEDDDDDCGRGIGMDENDSNAVNCTLTEVASSRSYEFADTDELMNTVDTVLMQTVIAPKIKLKSKESHLEEVHEAPKIESEVEGEDPISYDLANTDAECFTDASNDQFIKRFTRKESVSQDPCVDEAYVAPVSISEQFADSAFEFTDSACEHSTTVESDGFGDFNVTLSDNASSVDGDEKILFYHEDAQKNCESEIPKLDLKLLCEDFVSGDNNLNNKTNLVPSHVKCASSEKSRMNEDETFITADENGTVTKEIDSNLSEYPEFVTSCEDKIRMHYVSRYANECPLHWYRVPNKPDCQLYMKPTLLEKGGKNKVPFSLSDVDFQPGERILIDGTHGIGKSTALHKLLYDYGLNSLPFLNKFKLVFLIEAPRWSSCDSLKSVISNQILQDAWNVDINLLYDWMLNNPEQCFFIIDHVDDLFQKPDTHPCYQLFAKELFVYSTVLYTTSTKTFLSGEMCNRHFTVQKFSIEQVDRYVDRFIGENDRYLDDFKSALNSDYRVKEFYQIPLHLSIICILYVSKEVDTRLALPCSRSALLDKTFILILHCMGQDFCEKMSEDDMLSVYEDITFMISKLAMSALKDKKLSFTKEELGRGFEISADSLELFLEYGVLQKLICTDAYVFPYSLFRDFLAAKFIAIQYYNAAGAAQLGIECNSEEVTSLFRLCWSCLDDDFHLENVCVFLSGLLRRDCGLFIESFSEQYRSAIEIGNEDVFMKLAFECICENSTYKGFITLITDCMSDVSKTDFGFLNGEPAFGSCLDGVAQVISSGRLSFLDLSKLPVHDSEGLTKICTAINNSDRLRRLAVDFSQFTLPFEPTDSFSRHALLKNLVVSLENNSSLREIGFKIDIADMTMDALQISSRVFLGVWNDLKTLGVQISPPAFKPCIELADESALSRDMDSFEKLNLLVSRLNVFLGNNHSLEKLELNGYFLHKDILPEIKMAIIKQSHITSLHISGQHGETYHREAVIALADIVKKKDLSELSINLDGFCGKQNDYTEIDGYESELIISKFFQNLKKSNCLEKVSFSFVYLEYSMLEEIADFVEFSPLLKHVKIHCDNFDDLFLLFLGCGILCSFCIETVTLEGSFSSGGALAMFLQSCCQSPCLKELYLVGRPFSEDCLEWLVFSLSYHALQPVQPLQISLCGDTTKTDGNIERIINELKDIDLPLDIFMDVNLSA